MKEILKPSGNMGGLLQMWAIPAGKFWLTKNVLVFAAPDEVVHIYCAMDSIQLSEPISVKAVGRTYDTTVSGFIPGNRQSVLDAIQDMDGKRFVILLLDGNGNYILAGTVFYPLQLLPETNLGKNTADLAGVNIEFNGITITRAIIVDNPF